MNKWWQQDIEASISETESTNWGWLHANWYRFQDLATFLSLFFSFIPQSNQHENSQLCREGTRSRLPISHFGSEPHGVEDQEREKVMILRRGKNRTQGWKQLKAPPWMTCVLTYQNQNETKRMKLHGSSIISSPTQHSEIRTLSISFPTHFSL